MEIMMTTLMCYILDGKMIRWLIINDLEESAS